MSNELLIMQAVPPSDPTAKRAVTVEWLTPAGWYENDGPFYRVCRPVVVLPTVCNVCQAVPTGARSLTLSLQIEGNAGNLAGLDGDLSIWLGSDEPLRELLCASMVSGRPLGSTPRAAVIFVPLTQFRADGERLSLDIETPENLSTEMLAACSNIRGNVAMLRRDETATDLEEALSEPTVLRPGHIDGTHVLSLVDRVAAENIRPVVTRADIRDFLRDASPSCLRRHLLIGEIEFDTVVRVVDRVARPVLEVRVPSVSEASDGYRGALQHWLGESALASIPVELFFDQVRVQS